MQNITNIAIDSYTACGKERYIFNVDLKINGVVQNVVYCACPLDIEPKGKELYAEILRIKAQEPERIKSYAQYHTKLQQDAFDNHNADMEAQRQQRFKNEADGLYLKYQETQDEADKQKWIDKKNQIRAELPYLEEITQEQINNKYPLLRE